MVLRTRTLVATLAAAALLAAASYAMAQEKVSKDQAPAVDKARSDFMKSNGAQMKVLTSVAKGESPLDAKAVAAAQKLNSNAQDLLSHFPAGSGDDVLPKTRAKAAIWKNWDQFTKDAGNLKTETAALLVAANSGNKSDFDAKIKGVNNACGTCHKSFRSDPKKK
jgi:cytochrome c556